MTTMIKQVLTSETTRFPEHDSNEANGLFGLRNLERVNLMGEAYKELRHSLMTGRFQPGLKLNIRDLAAAMKISPTPVREALVQLAAEGALTQIAGRSFRVPSLSAEDYLELRDLRINLEGVGAAKAARRISDEAIGQLEIMHRQLVEAKESLDFQSALLWNQEFHLRICAEAGLPRLLRIVEGLWLQMGPLLNVLYARREMPQANPEAARHAHIEMIDALRSRNADLACRAMQADIMGSSNEILTNLQKTLPVAK